MADEWVLNEGERLDDLVRDDMKLIQRPDHFCFSVDSVLLAHYVECYCTACLFTRRQSYCGF